MTLLGRESRNAKAVHVQKIVLVVIWKSLLIAGRSGAIQKDSPPDLCPSYPACFYPVYPRSRPSFIRVFRLRLHQRQPIYARFFRSGRCCICGWLSSGAVRKNVVFYLLFMGFVFSAWALDRSLHTWRGLPVFWGR